jgi:hypothetical protein
MVNSHKPQRAVKRHINNLAPLGSEGNPAELPGTTPSQCIPDFAGKILGLEHLGEFLEDPAFM